MGRGFLLTLIFIGVISKSNVLATSASLILVLNLQITTLLSLMKEARNGPFISNDVSFGAFAGDQISTKT